MAYFLKMRSLSDSFLCTYARWSLAIVARGHYGKSRLLRIQSERGKYVCHIIMRVKGTVQFERCFRLMEHISVISCRNPINLYITEKAY